MYAAAECGCQSLSLARIGAGEDLHPGRGHDKNGGGHRMETSAVEQRPQPLSPISRKAVTVASKAHSAVSLKFAIK